MTTKKSTGLVKYVAETGSVLAGMAGTKILIFGNTMPATADQGSGGVAPLVTLNSVGTPTGITWQASATAGEVNSIETDISGVIATTGTAVWHMLVTSTDTGLASSTTAPRIIGTVGTSGADLNISSTALKVGASVSISDYTIAVLQ